MQAAGSCSTSLKRQATLQPGQLRVVFICFGSGGSTLAVHAHPQACASERDWSAWELMHSKALIQARSGACMEANLRALQLQAVQGECRGRAGM